jgi:hypothetical protein
MAAFQVITEGVVREACERCGIPVAGFRERELDQRANAAFDKAAAGVR